MKIRKEVWRSGWELAELKKTIISTICFECNFTPEELEFWTWLIWALGLQNN